nr:hypothetical protein [Tanacetum cinerariifolium]
MTTSSANNSVFRDKLNYLDQPIPHAPVAPSGQHIAPEILATHNAWIKGSKEIAGLMPLTMEPKIQQNSEPFHAHEMLRELKTLFSQQVEQELLQTTRDFHSCKQEEGQSVSSYVLNMKGYIDNLEHLGHPVTLGLGISLILIGLRKEYDGFVHNYNIHSMGKTFNELHAMLKLLEQTLPKNNAPALHAIRAGKVQKVNKHKKSQTQMAARGHNHGMGKNKQAYAPKPKIPLSAKREDPAKDSICHECGSKGNGQREVVEAVGAFFMSPEWIIDYGFIDRFVNNTIQVSRNNMVYFSAIPRDGIFEIDLSNPYTNESSIYAVSNKRAKLDLDSALLWHCHLGHISKKRIEKLQHDGLLDSSDLRDFENCDHGIITHHTPPYTPQHNGVSGRRNRTLLDMVRSMMSQTTLPKSFWDYALETSAHILNMVPTKKGCEELVKRDTLTKPDKLEPRSIKCIFIGYPKETMGYSFYYPPEKKVLVAQNSKFLENSLINQEASGSLEDLEIIQEEDTHPSIDTSLNHEEDNLEIDEPQSDIVPIHRSIRTRHAPDHMCLCIDAAEHELGDLGEPANYKAALLDPESEKWLNAINVKMQSMKDNEV